MAKQLRQGEETYIVPGIIGKRDEHRLEIIVESSGEKLDPQNIEDKITIFESQVNGWFLLPAFNLLEKENSGFVVLMVATAYIEEVEQYRRGKSSKGKSKKFFDCGIERIFEMNCKKSGFYRELRCGLFHNGMTGPGIRISTEVYNEPIVFADGGVIKINQKMFLNKVKLDFANYLEDLRNPKKTELRDNFNKMYVL